MRKTIFILVLLGFCFTSQSHSNAADIDKGFQWLINSQNQISSWGNTTTSINNEYFSTFEVLETFNESGQDNTAAYQNALQWLQAEELTNTVSGHIKPAT